MASLLRGPQRHPELRDEKDASQLKDEFEVLAGALGKGVTGVVQVAKRRRTGETFAVKICCPESMRKMTKAQKQNVRDSLRREILNEVALLRRMVGVPCVQQLEDFFHDPAKDRYFVVTRLCSGGELYDLFRPTKDGPASVLEESEVAVVVQQLSQAVEACHHAGIAHRDVKPQNVLLSQPLVEDLLVFRDSPIVTLIDFGIARSLTPGHRLHTRVGTPEYAAPEVFNGSSHDESCDEWSLGVVLFMLLCGEEPFADCSMHEIHKRQRKQRDLSSGAWVDVSMEAKDLVSRLLSYEPQGRIRVGDALKHPWFETAFSTAEARFSEAELGRASLGGEAHANSARRPKRGAISASLSEEGKGEGALKDTGASVTADEAAGDPAGQAGTQQQLSSVGETRCGSASSAAGSGDASASEPGDSNSNGGGSGGGGGNGNINSSSSSSSSSSNNNNNHNHKRSSEGEFAEFGQSIEAEFSQALNPAISAELDAFIRTQSGQVAQQRQPAVGAGAPLRSRRDQHADGSAWESGRFFSCRLETAFEDETGEGRNDSAPDEAPS